MLTERIEVDTTKLAMGMYVARLDRPWLETPFVFQGFEITDRAEIDQLQQYCSYVYVDIDRGKLTEAEIRSLIKSNGTKSSSIEPQPPRNRPDTGWLHRFRVHVAKSNIGRLLFPRFELEQDRYKIASTVRREAPHANAAYDAALSLHKQIVTTAYDLGAVDSTVLVEAVTPIIGSILRNPDAMAWTIFSRKRSGRNYSRAIATSVWAVMFGRHLGFGPQALRELAIGGLLLDIGNVRLPGDIVEAEGAITIEQYEELSQHVNLGVEILHSTGGMGSNVIDMVRCHHERADNSGYPGKLAGHEIPVFGRIAGIVNCYDAMTTKTSYSPAMAAYEAARILNDMRGTEFPAEVVEQFLQMIGMFPTGSVVELSNGNVGVVLEQNRSNPLRPKVMVLLDEQRDKLAKAKILDMQKLPDDVPDSDTLFIAKGHEHGAFGIDPLNYFKRPRSD